MSEHRRKGRMGVGGGSRQHGPFRSFCLRCRYCGQELIFASTGMTLELAQAYRDVYQENCLVASAQATAATVAGDGTVRSMDCTSDEERMAQAQEEAARAINDAEKQIDLSLPSPLSSKE